jgi:murein DD-endopeptidase MepM/ murein hydrolase activator NlpD
MEEASSKGVRVAKRRALLAAGFMLAVAGTAALAAPVVHQVGGSKALLAQVAELGPRMVPAAQAERLVWRGVDIDGDGQADFANPTGHDTRKTDAYGCGEFGARRDGGARRHEGVDFMAEAEQPLVAPISGYVTKIGLAYPGDSALKFVEITNPALHYAARVFYIDPQVTLGQAVRLGQPIGVHHTLEQKYPGGMTDHVHLEIFDTHGQRIDATQVITARLEPVAAAARG